MFEGICDGSAAVRLGEKQLLVAYDERNSFYLFDIDGGRYQQEIPFHEMLQLDGRAEADIEGAAISGDSIWWIGSHGLDGSAEHAPNRHVLFQTGSVISSEGQLAITRSPADILPLLLSDNSIRSILTDEVLQRPPKKGGFNIEGLAADADGNLLVALRSPLSSDSALVIRLRNTAAGLVPAGHYLLDLGGRGIRDIISVADGYLLIAGNTGGGGHFALFHWAPGSVAREVAEIPAGINAEALIEFADHWLVLSDDGKVTRPDSDANDGDRGCDRIYKKNPLGGGHKNVFFRAVKIPR
ncbi:hypothetical protein AB833_23765 [Chromatiales bacterium (ex Bugula neritina AB1)]|nr:hypothetical protein AB833_23765 [Chromatiales bacterium (ex Bugula neritina AB1)]